MIALPSSFGTDFCQNEPEQTESIASERCPKSTQSLNSLLRSPEFFEGRNLEEARLGKLLFHPQLFKTPEQRGKSVEESVVLALVVSESESRVGDFRKQRRGINGVSVGRVGAFQPVLRRVVLPEMAKNRTSNKRQFPQEVVALVEQADTFFGARHPVVQIHKL